MNELNAVADRNKNYVAILARNGLSLLGDISMTETNVPGYYSGTVPIGTPEGVYDVLILDVTTRDINSSGTLNWNGTIEIDVTKMVNELHILNGLQIGAPLLVTENFRTAGNISQTIESTASNTVVIRT